MESCIPNQQRIIRTTSHVFWAMQLTRNVSTNDEQYLPRTAPRENIGKLYGQLHDKSQDHRRTRRKDSLIFEDSRETQPVFQKIEIRLQHGRNPYFRSSCWQRADLNGTRKD